MMVAAEVGTRDNKFNEPLSDKLLGFGHDVGKWSATWRAAQVWDDTICAAEVASVLGFEGRSGGGEAWDWFVVGGGKWVLAVLRYELRNVGLVLLIGENICAGSRK